MVPVCAPSTTTSSTAVTVTVCATFQLAGVKVKVAGDTETWASVVSATVTSAVGAEFNATVNESVAPPSVTSVVPLWVTATPVAIPVMVIGNPCAGVPVPPSTAVAHVPTGGGIVLPKNSFPSPVTVWPKIVSGGAQGPDAIDPASCQSSQ